MTMWLHNPSRALSGWCAHSFDPATPASVAQHHVVVGKPGGVDFTRGRLAACAASVLMKLLYGARMARFDLLRAINSLRVDLLLGTLSATSVCTASCGMFTALSISTWWDGLVIPLMTVDCICVPTRTLRDARALIHFGTQLARCCLRHSLSVVGTICTSISRVSLHA
jgi:hypothetical protein